MHRKLPASRDRTPGSQQRILDRHATVAAVRLRVVGLATNAAGHQYAAKSPPDTRGPQDPHEVNADMPEAGLDGPETYIDRALDDRLPIRLEVILYT